MVINGYTLDSELQNANAGFSKWGFATKNGRKYFIKELVNPVYPTDRTVMSEEMFNERRAKCAKFEERFRQYYRTINTASCGNLIRINEFFRSGGRYYLVTEKVDENVSSVDILSRLSIDKKMLLLKTVANCFYKLHSSNVVHFDVKPANILVKKTNSGNYTAKLIDFDAGFFIGEDIENSELGGDLTYLAPETFLAMYGEDVTLNEKADIFALGLVFHQYCTGALPTYNSDEYDYPYEALLDGQDLVLDGKYMTPELCELVKSMLDVDPKNRPSAGEIFNKLNYMTGSAVPMTVPVETPKSVTGSRFKGSLAMRTGGAVLTGGSITSAAEAGTYSTAFPPTPPSKKIDSRFTSAGDL